MVRGFTQIAREDFGETFINLTYYTNARMAVCHGLRRGLRLRQLDIKNVLIIFQLASISTIRMKDISNLNDRGFAQDSLVFEAHLSRGILRVTFVCLMLDAR